VELTVTLTNLTPLLSKKKEFTIQVRPNEGAVVIVNRTLPAELKGVMHLK
jgi:archaellin